MTIMDGFYIWLAGALFWCVLMSAQGSGVDRSYLISAVIWPIMGLHLIGRGIRKIFT